MSALLSFFSSNDRVTFLQGINKELNNYFPHAQLECEALEHGNATFLFFDTLPAVCNLQALNEALEQQNINTLYFENIENLKNIKLAVFDMDSTLIQTEVIDELAAYADVKAKVASITEAAMSGELDFESSFIQRVAHLKGIQESALGEIASTLPLMPGAEILFTTLRHLQIKTAIISGGFLYFTEHLKQTLNADYCFANQLELINGELTGRHVGEIVGAQKKKQIMTTLAQQENISIEQCLAAGDGANDALMLAASGVGIAYHAKPVLKQLSKYRIDSASLDGLAVLLNKVFQTK